MKNDFGFSDCAGDHCRLRLSAAVVAVVGATKHEETLTAPREEEARLRSDMHINK